MTKAQKIKFNLVAIALLFIAALAFPTIAGAQGRGGNDKKAEVEARVSERKEQAKQRIEEKREAQEVKSEERRVEACERRVNKIESSMARVNTQANRLLAVMDRFYERVQGFYDSGQLTVSNYDELSEAADEAQNSAQVEIEALSELKVDVDCEDPEVVLSIGAYKSSANATKESLKAYRRSLVDLISAMKSAAAEAEGESNETENETESDESPESEQESEPELEVDNEIENAADINDEETN